MGYTVLPNIDRDRYTPMKGLEGPYVFQTGKVLYYDPQAGQYYDRDTDFYVSDKEMLVHYGLVDNTYNPRKEV
jgi:hypothetical protein